MNALVLLTCLVLPPHHESRGDGPSLKLPEKVQGQPGAFIPVKADTSGSQVRWVVLDPGLQLFPPDLLRDSRTAVVTTAAVGSYRLLAYTALKDQPSDPAVCTVVVGNPAPPVPPTPPGPPSPADPFAKAVADAYAREADPAKAQQTAFLAGIYRGASALLGQPDTGTAGGLFTKLSAAIHAPAVGIPKGSLPLVTKVVGQDLNQALGGTAERVPADAPVDADKIKAAFARYAAALEGLK